MEETEGAAIVHAEQRVWHCGGWRVSLARPVVMGILNVTPDSFSDGGRYGEPLDAIRHADAMVAAGAGIVDVGGESTRPGAEPVSVAEELARVRPVVSRLAAAGLVPVSIDTRRPEVARACVDAGASLINDISGVRDPAMLEVVSACDAGVVIMHMLGEPGSMQNDPRYTDVVAEVTAFLGERAAALEAAGVAPERIAVDPGIGFGKTHEHNLELLGNLPRMRALGYPLLVGVSRKRFIGNILGEEDPARRVYGSVGAAVHARLRGADVVRVHDVAETVQALTVVAAIER